MQIEIETILIIADPVYMVKLMNSVRYIHVPCMGWLTHLLKKQSLLAHERQR